MFKNDHEKRVVVETAEIILTPLIPVLNSETKLCIERALEILKKTPVESETLDVVKDEMEKISGLRHWIFLKDAFDIMDKHLQPDD